MNHSLQKLQLLSMYHLKQIGHDFTSTSGSILSKIRVFPSSSIFKPYVQKDTGIEPGIIEACLSGFTNGGGFISGCDSVLVRGT